MSPDREITLLFRDNAMEITLPTRHGHLSYEGRGQVVATPHGLFLPPQGCLFEHVPPASLEKLELLIFLQDFLQRFVNNRDQPT